MEDPISSKIYSEPKTDDCCEHFEKQEIDGAFDDRANGDDAGYFEPVYSDNEDIDSEDA